ncbi:unnamed protein product [Peniophora sp. CBMAI 1063]|nr:unnamed protein product [Peniophora sp. CBMAI 1063]
MSHKRPGSPAPEPTETVLSRTRSHGPLKHIELHGYFVPYDARGTGRELGHYTPSRLDIINYYDISANTPFSRRGGLDAMGGPVSMWTGKPTLNISLRMRAELVLAGFK